MATLIGINMSKINISDILLPCPFCGSDPETDNGFAPLESIYYVWCSNPDCELSPAGRDERLFDIKWWNTRATLR